MKLRLWIILPVLLFLAVLLGMGAQQFKHSRSVHDKLETLFILENNLLHAFDNLSELSNEHFRLSIKLWKLNSGVATPKKQLSIRSMIAELEKDMQIQLNELKGLIQTNASHRILEEQKDVLALLDTTMKQYLDSTQSLITAIENTNLSREQAMISASSHAASMNVQIHQVLDELDTSFHSKLHNRMDQASQTISWTWWVLFSIALFLCLFFSVIGLKTLRRIRHITQRFQKLFPDEDWQKSLENNLEGIAQLDWLAERLTGMKNELRLSHSRFERMISNSSTAIYVFNKDHKLLYANRSLLDLCGFENEEEFLKLPHALDIIDPIDRESLTETAPLQETEQSAMELRICHKKGGTRWVLYKSFNVDWDGRPAICVNLLDINEQKKTLRDLMDSQDRFRVLLELTPDPIVIFNTQGDILDANMAAAESLGYDLEELKDMHVSDFSPVEKNKISLDSSQHHTSYQPIETLQAYHRRSDGSTFPVEVHMANGILDDEKVILTIAHDMSDTMAHIEELDYLRKKAEEASRAKSDFLSMMSHELRTPLNSIIGYSDLFLQGSSKQKQLPPSSMEWLRQIRSAGQSLLDIVDKALDLIAIDNENDPFIEATCELGARISFAIERLEDLAEKHEVRITVHNHLNEKAFVRISAKSLDIIFENLLSNAIKFNIENGSVRIDVDETSMGQYCVSFTDTGIGMTPDQLKNVFKPFDRLGRENGPVAGSGIGLTIVEKICEQVDGKIEVELPEQGGCRFNVYLPVALVT